MHLRRYLCWLSIFFIVLFLFWQISLIIITLFDLVLSLPEKIYFQPQNLSEPRIPPIIHQMWKTSNLSTYPIPTSHQQWKTFYPDYTIRLWTDADLKHLISSEPYNYLQSIYHSYPYDIQRADLARLVVLHHQGGIYADLDVSPHDRSMDKLRLSGASLIIPRAMSDSSLINHFMASERHSEILDHILHRVSSNSWARRIFLVPYLQVFSTGSIFLTRVIRQWLSNCSNHEQSLWILTAKQVSIFVAHDAGRSWHLFDGYLLNQIERIPTLIQYILLCFLIVLVSFGCFFVCFPVLFGFVLQYHRRFSSAIRLMSKL